MSTLEKFEDAINKMIKETHPEPARFNQMIRESSILEACKALLESDKISSGFTNMWLAQRLDLTVEHIVANNLEFQSLFTKHQVDNAIKRIKESN